MMSAPESIALKQIGISVSIFIGGGLASFAFFYYWKSRQPPPQRNPELIRQINDLKQEIVTLKGSLTTAVSDFRRELDGIRGALSTKKTRSIVSNRTSGTYRTAWSDDEFPSDDEFTVPPDYLESEERHPSTLEAICSRVDELQKGVDDDKEEAMRLLQDNEANFSQSWEFLWRLSRAHVSIYSNREDYDVRRLHATSALEYAASALRLNEDSFQVHKWYAISKGATTDFVGTKEKIECGHDLKKHIDQAIALKPDEPTLHFMKGRWCWGVYMLTWLERKLASTLFATPPSATIDDALSSFLKAEELHPGFYKANQLYLAKCYYDKHDYEEAKRCLRSAKSLPINDKDDRDTHKEVEQLLDKL